QAACPTSCGKSNRKSLAKAIQVAMERFKEWLSEWMDYLSDDPTPPILLMAVLVWIAAFRFGFDRLEPGIPVLFAWLGLSSVAAVFVVLWVYRKPQEDRE